MSQQIPFVVDGEPRLKADGSPVMVPDDMTPEEAQEALALTEEGHRIGSVKATGFGGAFGGGLAAGGREAVQGMGDLVEAAQAGVAEPEMAHLMRKKTAREQQEFNQVQAAKRTQLRMQLEAGGVDPDSFSAQATVKAGEFLGDMGAFMIAGGPARMIAGEALAGSGMLKGLGRVVAEGAISAGEGAAAFVETPAERAMTAATTGGIGFALSGIMESLGGFRRFISKDLIRDLTRDGGQAVQDSLALARKAELPEEAAFLPGQLTGSPTIVKLQKEMTGGPGSRVQKRLDAQLSEGMVQFDKMAQTLGRQSIISPKNHVRAVGEAVEKSTKGMKEARAKAWNEQLKGVMRRTGGRVGAQTGEIIEAGDAVIPGDSLAVVLDEIKKSIKASAGPVGKDEASAITRRIKKLQKELKKNDGHISVATANDWLVKLTKAQDMPQFNVRANQIKDAILDDMGTIDPMDFGGDPDVARALLEMRANYKVASTAITKLEKSAVGEIFEKFDIDVLGDDFGDKIFAMSPGNLRDSVKQIDKHVGKEYGDAVRAEYIGNIANRASVIENGEVVGIDPGVAVNLMQQKRRELAVLMPAGTQHPAYIRGLEVLKRFAIGRDAVARSAEAEAGQAVLTGGSMIAATGASAGFAGQLGFKLLNRGKLERLMADPHAIEWVQKLGKAATSKKEAVIQEVASGLGRYLSSDDSKIERDAIADNQRLEELIAQQAAQLQQNRP